MALFDYNKTAGNPLLQTGLGILANNTGHYGQFAPAFGRGAQQGMQNVQQHQQFLALKKQREQMAAMQQQRHDLQTQSFNNQLEKDGRHQFAIDQFSKQHPEYANLAQLNIKAATEQAYPSSAAGTKYQALGTANGYARFNPSTGQMELMEIDGQAVLPASQDPRLQSRKTSAIESAKSNYKITKDIPGMVTTEANAINLMNSPSLQEQAAVREEYKPYVDELNSEFKRLKNAKTPEEQAEIGARIDALKAHVAAAPEGVPGVSVPTKAEEAAEVEASKLSAKNQVEAESEVQLTEDLGNEAIKLVDELLDHEGFSGAVGLSSYNPLNKVAGSPEKDFSIRLDQIKGKQFLQAFETLKGAGQITEVEGKKATDAISRMNTAASEGEFRKAAREFQDVIRQGMARSRKKAGLSTSNSAPSPGKPMRGQVIDGYKFKGGDPADSSNWEAQ